MIKKIFIYIIISIFFFACGFAVSFINDKDNSRIYFQEGWRSAMNRVKKFGQCETISENIPINRVSGVIESVDKNFITVKISPLSPFDDPSLDTRILTINNDTKIVQVVEMDQDKYKQKLAEFYKTRDQYANEDEFLSHMPSRQIERDIGINDLKVGQKITAFAADKNIRNKKKFLVKKIKSW